MDKEFYLIFGIRKGKLHLQCVYQQGLDNFNYYPFYLINLTDQENIFASGSMRKEEFMLGDVYIRKDGTKVYIKDLKDQEIDEITEAVNKGLERTDLNFEKYAEYSSQCNRLMKALNEERTKRGV